MRCPACSLTSGGRYSVKYSGLAGSRNNRLVGFKHGDFKFSQRSGKPLAVTMHRSYQVEVKPAGLWYGVDRSYDSLWIVEYAEPVRLDQDGSASEVQGEHEYGSGPALDKSHVGRKGKKKGPKPKKRSTTKQPRTKKPSSHHTRQRVSKVSPMKEDDLLPVVPLEVSSFHCHSDAQQCGWAVRQDLDPNDGLPDAATASDTLDGSNVLVPDKSFFVGEGVRGFALAEQLARRYAIIERCSFVSGYNCRVEFHRYDDLTVKGGGIAVVRAAHLYWENVLLDPGLPPDETRVVSGGGTTKNKKTKSTDTKTSDKKARSGDSRKKRKRLKKGKGSKKKGTKSSVAKKKKGKGKKPDTSVKEQNMGESATMTSAIRLPTGATGMAYRVTTTENFLMFSFSSAAQPNFNHVLINGQDVEDSVHLMWLPGMATIPPDVQQNIIYVKYKFQCVACRVLRSSATCVC